MKENYKILIEKSIDKIFGGIDLVGSIIKFIDFLNLKNNEFNLISRKASIDEIINDHLLDSIYGFPFLKSFYSITDLGSGGGFPGIILGIVFPEKKINLIEKSPKKCIFLDEAKRLLDLKNISINNALVEETDILTDAITCRAFKEINAIIDMTKNFFNRGGIYVLYKARHDKIIEELENAARKHEITYSINKINEAKEKERHIVVINKKNKKQI